MKIAQDPVQPGDGTKEYRTIEEGWFYPECLESLSLMGKHVVFPEDTPVWIVWRANGRLLLQTDNKHYRWADPWYLKGGPKKKKTEEAA